MLTSDRAGLMRSMIVSSQYLAQRSTGSVEAVVSDICGLQYDPNPTIHLNQYMMLWNRKQGFTVDQLDTAAYQEFRVLETVGYKRNLFFVPYQEYAIYRTALRRIERWGETNEMIANFAADPQLRAEDETLKEGLYGLPAMTAKDLWIHLGLLDEWMAFRKSKGREDFLQRRAFYRLLNRGEILRGGRKPGTFKSPMFILKENLGIESWPNQDIGEDAARDYIIEKLISSLGVTYPVHISHITGIPTVEVAIVFDRLEQRKTILPLPFKVGRKVPYIHHSKARFLDEPGGCAVQDTHEIRLISPMDTLVRDQTWLKTFFDYSYTFEYFKKKGMKWPLSILVGNRFVGYLDCKMEWNTKRFIVKERNIFDAAFDEPKKIDLAIEALAAFHEAKEIIKKP